MVTTHNLGLAKKHTSQVHALQLQENSDLLSIGCSGVSDPMVTMMDMLGHRSETKHFKAYQDAPWFGSDVRCVVPEFTQNTGFTLNAASLINEIKSSKKQGSELKPIIIGPISYLWFGEAKGNVNKLDLLETLLAVYADLLKQLSDAGIEWVQLDEPILTQEIDEDWKHALLQAYFHLQRSPIKKLLACYFGKLGDNLGLLRELTVDGVHLDTISAEDEALKVADWLPNYKIISVSVVNGSQSEKTDSEDTLAWLKPIHELLGDRLWLAPSCSLLHQTEADNQPTITKHSTFKLDEIKLLAKTLDEQKIVEEHSAEEQINVRKAAA